MNNTMKRFKGDVHVTVEEIGRHFHIENQRVNELRGRVEQLEQRQNHATVRSNGNASIEDVRAFTESQLDFLSKVIMRMDRLGKDLIADTQQDAVKFNSFGFRRVEEANAWVEANLPKQKFGLIINAHMVFEQLHSSPAKTIPTLQQLAKTEMKDLSQGVAVSSFDQQLPKILSDVTGYVVVQKDESHFNQVKNHKEWAEPQTRFGISLRLILKCLSRRIFS
jgi:predicted Zn-dependent protease with MMP-like domain